MTSQYLWKLLKERLTETPFFGIMIDETTDISTTQQLILYIKYLKKDKKKNTFSVEIEYLDLVSPVTCTAGGITVTSNFEMLILDCYSQSTEKFWLGSKESCGLWLRWLLNNAWQQIWCGDETQRNMSLCYQFPLSCSSSSTCNNGCCYQCSYSEVKANCRMNSYKRLNSYSRIFMVSTKTLLNERPSSIQLRCDVINYLMLSSKKSRLQ